MTTYTQVQEPISVAMLFDENQHPAIESFQWDGRQYLVDKVEVVNRMHKGQDVVYMFSVATDSGAYKLRFNTSNLRWWLEEIYWEE